MSDEFAVASVNPVAVPDNSVDTESNHVEQEVSDETLCVSAVVGTRYIGFFRETMHKIKVVDTQSQDTENDGFDIAS